jgi:lysine 2,3-aminomutase
MITGPVERQMGWDSPPAPGSDHDPLGEQGCSPVPGVVMRYPDRVLVLAARSCFTRCAFCTRLAFVRDAGESGLEVDTAAAVEFVRTHGNVREVIVSGGDPLTLDDAALDDLLGRLGAIPHVRLLRVATRAPMARPGRVTHELCSMLASHGPMLVAVHFNHPDELTDASRAALARLVDAGLVVINQAVLLRDVNDETGVLARLFFELASCRVRPYYLLQCDRVASTERFWVDLGRALEIVSGLEGLLPGHALPWFVVDLPR